MLSICKIISAESLDKLYDLSQKRLTFPRYSKTFVNWRSLERKFHRVPINQSHNYDKIFRNTNDIRAQAINCNRYESIAIWPGDLRQFIIRYCCSKLSRNSIFPWRNKIQLHNSCCATKIDYPYTLCRDTLENLKHGRRAPRENMARVILNIKRCIRSETKWLRVLSLGSNDKT